MADDCDWENMQGAFQTQWAVFLDRRMTLEPLVRTLCRNSELAKSSFWRVSLFRFRVPDMSYLVADTRGPIAVVCNRGRFGA